MKAKMPPNQKPPEFGEYECLRCDKIFLLSAKSSQLICPECGNTERQELIPIYMENYPPEEKMYTSSDWHGGA